MSHTCKAVVITCIDFRFQKVKNSWIKENLGDDNHDRVAWAGGVKDWENVLNQIDISKRLHDISQVVLMNHENCGAYGDESTSEKHAKDLNTAKKSVLKKYPDLEVKTFYLHLDGEIEEIN